jgi:ATP-dependent DNA ligase
VIAWDAVCNPSESALSRRRRRDRHVPGETERYNARRATPARPGLQKANKDPLGQPSSAELARPLPACHLRCMEWRTKPPMKRPGMIEPCIPTRATKPPVGPQWIHEIKRDGYRLIARKRDSRVRLFTRNGFDWTERYPRITAAVGALRALQAVVGGRRCGARGTGWRSSTSSTAEPMTAR